MNVEIRDSRQKHVIRCAENTFFEKGFSKTTISDICKAANCSRSTLYIHFENKENIYLAVINNAFKIFLKYFEDLTVEGQNGLENMILYSEGFVDYSKKFPKRYSLIIDFTPYLGLLQMKNCSQIQPLFFRNVHSSLRCRQEQKFLLSS